MHYLRNFFSLLTLTFAIFVHPEVFQQRDANFEFDLPTLPAEAKCENEKSAWQDQFNFYDNGAENLYCREGDSIEKCHKNHLRYLQEQFRSQMLSVIETLSNLMNEAYQANLTGASQDVENNLNLRLNILKDSFYEIRIILDVASVFNLNFDLDKELLEIENSIFVRAIDYESGNYINGCTYQCWFQRYPRLKMELVKNLDYIKGLVVPYDICKKSDSTEIQPPIKLGECSMTDLDNYKNDFLDLPPDRTYIGGLGSQTPDSSCTLLTIVFKRERQNSKMDRKWIQTIRFRGSESENREIKTWSYDNKEQRKDLDQIIQRWNSTIPRRDFQHRLLN